MNIKFLLGFLRSSLPLASANGTRSETGFSHVINSTSAPNGDNQSQNRL
jgi:hypothetical protein